jgi:hypothetical protein
MPEAQHPSGSYCENDVVKLNQVRKSGNDKWQATRIDNKQLSLPITSEPISSFQSA